MSNRSILMAGLISSTAAAWSGAAQAGWSDGVLSITNARHDPVRVLIDQRSYGEILPGQAEVFRLSPGRHDVQVIDFRGTAIQREAVLIQAFQAEAMLLNPVGGELDITNQTGAVLQLLLDGRPAGSLPPGAMVELAVEPGRHQLSAVFEQCGQTRTIAERTMRVDPGEQERITLTPPATGLVRVINEQNVPATVQLNGAWAGSVGPLQSVVFEAPVGEAWVVVVAESGRRTLEQERLIVSPFADNIVKVEQDPFGTLAVYNPLPIPVTLKSGRHARTLQPYERDTWGHIPAGRRSIEVYRLTGEKIGDLDANVLAGRTASISVSPPRDDIIAFTNASAQEAWVYVDGVLVERVPPGAQARMIALPGAHEVKVLVSGRMVYKQRHSIDLYSDTLVGVGRGYGGGSYSYGDRDDDHHHGHGGGHGGSRGRFIHLRRARIAGGFARLRGGVRYTLPRCHAPLLLPAHLGC